MSVKCSITMLFLVICCFILQGQSLSVVRQKRSGTADQELFHLLEKMKHRPVAGIIDVNRIGKRQSQDNYSQWRMRAQEQEWPVDQSYFY